MFKWKIMQKQKEKKKNKKRKRKRRRKSKDAKTGLRTSNSLGSEARFICKAVITVCTLDKILSLRKVTRIK